MTCTIRRLRASSRLKTGLFQPERDRQFESPLLQRGVRNEPVPQRPQNYGAKRFTSDKRNWGYQLRFGLFEISDVDMSRIARDASAAPAVEYRDAPPI